MSIHVQLSPEAIEKLHRQRRNSTIASIVMSLLVILIIAFILGMFLLPGIIKETPSFVTYLPPKVEEPAVNDRKITHTVKRKPSAPAPSMNRVIATAASAPISIPIPEIEVATPTIEFGDGLNFGGGWSGAVDFGAGASLGGGGGFGSSDANSGGLEGHIYDLKQTRNRKPLDYSPTIFVNVARELIDKGFKDSAFKNFFRAPKPLYLTRLAVPMAPAEDGPSFFEAEKDIEPRGWIAHYRGTVVVPKTGSYRFSGGGDDFVHVMINGKTVFNYYQTLESLDPKNAGYNPEQPQERRRAPFTRAGWWIRYGEWVDLKAGEKIELDIAAGETPGGQVGFLLQLEEKGVSYEMINGNPILPLFTTAKISEKEEKELKEQYSNYPLDFKNTLVFPVSR